MSVCMRAMAGRTAGPIKTKLGIGTHVDPGSVLGKVKVKVMWRHLANANKTAYRITEFERDKYLAPPGECQFLTEARKGRENSLRDKYGGRGPQGRDNRARIAIANKTRDRGP